ncbi:unnamed protein product [Closterium sp. Yama58-4]|nr:unnamed protein product [Closterium sp. Yama58-4]
MGKGPGSFSDIGKKAKELLFKHYAYDHSINISTKTDSGLKFQTASVKKGDEVSCDVKTEVEIGNVEAEFKLDTKSKLYFKAVYEDLAPGLKLALTGIVPDSKATKAELTYKQELLHVNATVGLVTQPVFEGALAVGTKGVVVGAELGYDTATNSATKYNLGVAYSESDFSASLLIADKLDTLKAAYFQKVKKDVEVAAEAAHKLSKSDTTFTAGASFELDPLTEAKLRFNNRGTVAALLQHEFRPKSKVTIAGEVDSKALDKEGDACANACTGQKGQAKGGSAQRVSGNPYVERVVQVAVGAALGKTGGGAGVAATDKWRLREKLARAGVRIIIAGDNDFYSHRHTLQRMGLPLSASSLVRIPSFAPIVSNPPSASPATLTPPVAPATPDASAATPDASAATPDASAATPDASAATDTSATPDASAGQATRGHMPEVAKTGLGSSAAMTAAVSAALLRFLGVLGGTGSAAADEDCQERAMGSGSEESFREEAVGRAGTVGRKEVVHRVAQVAHCLAQGKAGSGFDVAAGVFGSMCYQRFNPSVMHALMGAEAALTVSSISATLRSPLWDHTIAPLHLPPGLLLVLGEPGTGGTATPSMLSAVMKWRRQSPGEAEPIWDGLKEANAAVAAALSHLSLLARTHPDSFSTTLNRLQHVPLTAASPVAPVAAATEVNPVCASYEAAGDLQAEVEVTPESTPQSLAGTPARDSSDISHTSSTVEPHAPQQPQERQELQKNQVEQGGDISNTILHALRTLRSSFLSVRHLLCAMGSAAATPIEPPQQTALLDATMQQQGVVMAGVPVPGGFDSVFAVVVGEEAARRLDGVWAGMGVMQMGVRSAAEGMRWEEVEGVMRRLRRG